MRQFGQLSAVAFLFLASAAARAQEPSFGKNKVIWKEFDWSYISTKHYDVYFYGQNYNLAKFSAEVLENVTPQIEKELNYKLREKVPVIVYDSHNDFQQTNVGGGLIPEGVGGFTESFKNRVVLPFNGSYEDFRHVLHHELTHAFTFDMLYGGNIGSFLSASTLFELPLWFAEGFAEYSSQHGMDYFGDMVLRDAAINNYLIPLEYAGGFIVYKEGQSALRYIADHFGQEKIAELLQRSRTMLSMERGLKASLGLSMKDFNKEWSKALKRDYWPEIARRQEPKEIGKPLTRHEDQGSNFNEKPAFSPKGDRIAIFSDKSDYTEVYVISAVDGKFLKRLVKGERSGDFESLHSYVSGLSWSPDGERLALVGKSKGKDALIIVDAKSGDVKLRRHFTVTSLLNPAWGPGDKIAFMGMVEGKADMYVYDLKSEELSRHTNDWYDDNDPTWSPDGRYIVFASDRPVDGSQETDVTAFDYGRYHLFRLELGNGKIEAITKGGGNDRAPAYDPKGERIAYISDRNGIANIYVLDLTLGDDTPVTNILTGAASPSWSPDGAKLVFSSFNNGGFDIFLMEKIQPQGKEGVLEPTSLAIRKQKEATSDKSEPVALRLPATPVDTAGPVASVDSAKADTTQASLTPPRDNGHFGSLRFRSEEEEKGDSTSVALRKADLTQDTVVILDPKDDSIVVAERVEEAKKSGQTVNGEYKVHDYKAKFTPDLVTGTLGYNTYLGLQGQSYLLVSDYMNNHQFFLATDVANTFDDANVLFFYLNSTRRNNFGLGAFHTKRYYIDNDLRLIARNATDTILGIGRLFSDRVYGATGAIVHPLSLFRRLELNVSHFYIDREYYDPNPEGVYEDRDTRATIASLSWVSDNTLWGYTGPVNGGRANLTLEHAFNMGDKNISYSAVNADWRRYMKLGKGFSFATRLAGGYSGGRSPKLFYVGGVNNWIGSDVQREDEIYTVQSLYFSQLSFPLRGYDYFELAGTRYGIANFELRYPFIDYLALRFPLGLTLAQVQGALFVDAGTAWDQGKPLVLTSSTPGSRLQDLKVGYGFGVRANLGFLVFRYDVAWPTDFRIFARRAAQYVSLGADF
jgi:Tol biopolymer transport system component